MSTLRDVARRSGVSPATVSNVLNNRATRVSGETRRRVLQAMRDLDYRPGAAVAGGIEQRQVVRTIGIFLWMGYRAPLTSNPYALTILDGILTVMLADHWNVTLIAVQNWKDARAQVRLYADGRCDGFLLIALPETAPIPQALAERHYPFVVIGSGMEATGASGVTVDNAAAQRELTAHLIAQGHRRIAYLLGDEAQEDVQERKRGYLQALAEAGLEKEERLIEPGTYDLPESTEIVNEFIDRFEQASRAQRPTALLCGNDLLAYNAWKALAARGIRIPEDLSMAGFDDTEFATRIDPPLTTVRQPLFDLGLRGAQLLQQQMRERTGSKAAHAPGMAVKAILPHELVIRGSVARLGVAG